MTLKRWLPTFLAFPLGGLVAIETVGSAHGPASAAAAGLVAGAIIGAGQWLALRPRGIGRGWIGATAAAMGAGAAASAAVTGAGTAAADVLATGLITGAAVAAAQGALLHRGRRAAAAWTAVGAGAWALGWLATWLTIVDVERGYAVFGSSGAILVTLLTGAALRVLLGTPARAAVAA
jgi:hypothetical protein